MDAMTILVRLIMVILTMMPIACREIILRYGYSVNNNVNSNIDYNDGTKLLLLIVMVSMMTMTTDHDDNDDNNTTTKLLIHNL